MYTTPALRDDFEVEFSNEAESLVAVIEADGGKGEGEEDEVETLCKLAQVRNCLQDPLVLYYSLW